jgi:hypothetical protein
MAADGYPSKKCVRKMECHGTVCDERERILAEKGLTPHRVYARIEGRRAENSRNAALAPPRC